MGTIGERRLCAVFEAGQTRYCVEAVSVTEVARVQPGDDTVRGHLPLKDLCALLGGGDEVRPGEAVVLDTSPTLALRVARVDGVIDCSGFPQLPLPRRLVPLLSPAVRGGLDVDGRLVFELDADSLARGLPRQSKKLELVVQQPAGSALTFETGERMLAVPLDRVLQVVALGPAFNAAPSAGVFQGVVEHQLQLVPVYSLAGAPVEPFLVIVELGKQDWLALSARRAAGVVPADRLGTTTLIDLPRTFS